MMPISGTSSTSRSGTCRRIRRKSAVPASAKTAATSILPKIGVSGASRVTVSRPRPADLVVPAVEGSTKRLRTSICMMSPAIAIELPASISASVRGMRLTSSTRSASALVSGEKSVASETLLTPTNRLAMASTRARIRADISERDFTLAVSGKAKAPGSLKPSGALMLFGRGYFFSETAL